MISEGGEVELEGFGFDAEFVRNILNLNGGEVWLSGDWTEGSEVFDGKSDHVIAVRVAVGKCLEGCGGGSLRERGFGAPQ